MDVTSSGTAPVTHSRNTNVSMAPVTHKRREPRCGLARAGGGIPAAVSARPRVDPWRCEHSSGRVPAGDGCQGGGAAVGDAGLLPLPPAAATPAWIRMPVAPPQADRRTSLFFFAKNTLVPVGISNQYQWMPKAPGEKSGVLG